MEIRLIWAQAHQRAIGRDNTLPWRLPEDLQRFKQLTLGHPVLMGRKTFESLPNGPLPGRQNIVLTRNAGLVRHPGAVYAVNLEAGLQLAGTAKPARVCVIGGAELYAQALKIADRIDVTEVDLDVPQADAFAPALPSSFSLKEESAWLLSASGVRYRFLRFDRSRR